MCYNSLINNFETKGGDKVARKTKQQEIDELRAKVQELCDRLEEKNREQVELADKADKNFINSPYCRQLEQELDKYKKLYDSEKQSKEKWKKRYYEIQEKYRILYETEQNRKKAGRKLHDGKWMEQYDKFCEMIESGLGMEEIMRQLGISRATYFRLKKVLKEQQ